MRIIESFGPIRDFPPTRSLTPIWDRVSSVLRHHRALNIDQAAVGHLQQSALRNGVLPSPSIHGEGDDVSVESFYMPHVFAYLFRHARGDYVWLTTQLDRGFGFGVLVLPWLDLAITLYPFSINEELLRRLADVRAGVRRATPALGGIKVPPRVVTGYFHMMHVLWNELPAIDRALAAGVMEGREVGYMHQPLGPLDEIFPELRGRLTALPDDDAVVNSGSPFIVGLGSWTISASTQERLRVAARTVVRNHIVSEIRQFREEHWPIFWLSMKPPNRSFIHQGQILAGLMLRLQSTYPNAGFLLNGVGYPWDAMTNPNYADWFHDAMRRASHGTAEIVGEIYPLLKPEVRARTRIVSEVDILEEICWSGLADFYFCHGGSMQNKIAWVNDVGGVMHSNSSFTASAQGMAPPTLGKAETYVLPNHLVTDDDPGRYSALELARKDQNYAIDSIDDVAAFVIDCFRASRA